MPSKGDSALHRKTWHQLNLFRPPWTCGQCERKVYLWCMHCEGCGFCLTTVECPMRGRIPPDEDAWLYRKWKTEVDVDSLLQATLPPGPVEDEVDSYEALVLAGRVSELSNTATPEQDAVVPVLAPPSNVAKPLMAGISEEEDIAIPVAPARMATRRTPVDETKPLVVGDWLSDKDIVAWQNDKLYHNEVEEPRAWTMAVTYIASCLNRMRKYEDSKGNNHKTVRLAWRRRHMFIVNSDDREGLHWFLCAIDCKVPVWAFKVHIWEPLCGTSLVRPMLKRLQSKGVAAHARALGFQEDGWSCGYQSLYLCDEVANQRGSLDDVVVTRLPKGFIKEALRIINADRSARVPGTIPENGWEKELTCWKPGESPPPPASNPESLPPPTSPLLFDEEDRLSEPEGNIAASSSEPKVGEFPAFPASNSEDVPQDGKSVKGNVKAPPQTPQSTSSSNPPTSDDARPSVFICRKFFEVPEAYPKGAGGRLVNDKRFIRELEEMLVKDIRNACARNINPRAKPKASDTKSDLIYKRVFADFL